VRRLAGPGTQIVLPTRDASRAAHLADLPGIEVVTADLHDSGTLDRLAGGTQVAINLVGVLHSKPGRPWGPEFDRAHVALPRSLAAACRRAGTSRLIHISALGADPDGPSEYQRSKAAGEQAIHDGCSPPAWTILRPSVVFGPGDSFLNLFAQLVRFIPVLPLAGAHTRFQPVFVGDVAEVVAHCLDSDTAGRTFELAGPKTYSLAELVRYVCRVTGRNRLVVPLPEPLAMVQALAMELLPKPPISRDNVRSLRRDNVTAGPPLPFDMAPTPLEDIAPGYLAGSRH
jgi:uncharacterized protein YbjT (DUF2867 family)